MAYEADRVIVALIADNSQFDQPVNVSAKNYDASMNTIVAAAGKAEAANHKMGKSGDEVVQAFALQERRARLLAQTLGTLGSGHDKLNASTGNARIAQLEFTHAVRGAADQIAAGAPPMQVFATHLGQVTQAAGLAGGSLGKFGTFMSGPWGIALTIGGVALAAIIGKIIEGHDEAGKLVEKLKEHARQTGLSEEADRLWAQTIDGLIERHKKLNEELGKRLQVQALVDQATLAQQQDDLTSQENKLAGERQHLADLRKQLAAQPEPESFGPSGDPLRTQVEGRISQLQKSIKDSQTNIGKLEEDVARVKSNITGLQITVGQTQGKALADLTAAAQLFGQEYEGAISAVIKANPKLGESATQIEGAAQALIKAGNEAGAAGVNFSSTAHSAEDLGRDLLNNQVSVKLYTQEIKKLAKALEEQTKAAKEAAKVNPVEQFKRSVIGAEGTGGNQMGSSAAGFGQFINGTWLSYFNKLFPDKSDLSDAAKLAYRNVRSVAEAVIDKATDDYVDVLKTAGKQITAANLYAVHILGSKDASKFFAAAPGADTRSFLSQKVLAGNPFLKGTVAQAQAAISKRIGDSSAAVSQGAAAIAQVLQQEKERAAQYLAEKDRAEEQVIDARKGLAKAALDIWAFETAANIAAHKHSEDQIAAQEVAGKLLPQEAVELKKINDERAKYRQQLVDQRLRQAKFAEAEQNFQRGRDFQSGSYSAESELLESQQALAKTAKQRREIEQRLIDLQFAEEKLKNQYIIDWAARVQANKDATEQEKADAALAAQIAKMHQGTLPQRQANATEGNSRANASPLQSYLQSIPQTAAEIDDALEQVAANGLQSFANGIADAIVNFRSLGDVARSILSGLAADLIKLAVQQVILHTIGSSLGAASVATTTAAAAAAGAAWAGPAALASLATLGANAGPAAAALASTTALATILGAPKAGGGRIRGTGSDTSDNILTPMSPGEFAIKAQSARNIGYDALEFMNEHGRLPMGGGGFSPVNVHAARGGGRGGFSQEDIRTLSGIISEAALAMPDVSLYASLDPADMLQRALGSPAGHRAFLAHLSNNSSAVKASLNRP